MAAAAAEEGGDAAFAVVEGEVLRWLLRRTEVATAVDMALAGREGEALPTLLRVVRDILGPEEVGVPGSEPEHPAQKRRKLGQGGINVAEVAPRRPAAAPAVHVEAAVAPTAGTDAENAARPEDWLAQCRRALEAERERENDKLESRRLEGAAGQEVLVSGPSPLYWKLDLPEVSKVLAQKGLLPQGLVPVTAPHATLLYLGDEGSDVASAKRLGMTLEEFQAMRESLQALDGEEFDIRMTQIVIEESVACAVVSLPTSLPCAAAVPHITLGLKPGVPGRYANDMLEEVRSGARREGVTTIELPVPRPLRGKVMLEYTKTGAA